MSTDTTCEIVSSSPDATLAIGAKLGSSFNGGEVLELISDVGGGKTALARGLAAGIGSRDQVMSPTFTISRIYHGPKLDLHHFDFYRLSEPGIMKAELTESLADPQTSVIIEWSAVVAEVLPAARLQIRIEVMGENSRRLKLRATDKKHARLVRLLP